jgi:hypothetical protein
VGAGQRRLQPLTSVSSGSGANSTFRAESAALDRHNSGGFGSHTAMSREMYRRQPSTRPCSLGWASGEVADLELPQEEVPRSVSPSEPTSRWQIRPSAVDRPIRADWARSPKGAFAGSQRGSHTSGRLISPGRRFLHHQFTSPLVLIPSAIQHQPIESGSRLDLSCHTRQCRGSYERRVLHHRSIAAIGPACHVAAGSYPMRHMG